MLCAIWPPSMGEKQIKFLQRSRARIQREPLNQKHGVFSVPTLSGCSRISMSHVMMDPRSNSGDLGGAGSVGKLIPVSFIGKQDLTMGVYTQNPVNHQSLLVSTLREPKMGVFYPLCYSFPSIKPHISSQ